MTSNTPVDSGVVSEEIANLQLDSIGSASIREIVQLVNNVEERTGVHYVRMEMGVPGLPPVQIGVDAEIAALRKGVASVYPMLDGCKELKEEASRFVRLFMNISVSPAHCVPTVGSMQGTFAAFIVGAGCRKERDTALFIDPGFPVQKQQMLVLGQKYESFDVYKHRGSKLRACLESYLEKGNIHSIIYSNPNNPSWICLTEEELQIIGECANKYDVIILEDLAYFAMDFRKDLSKPGEPPFQSTVARYTDNYVLFISSSKIFSYAGQRCAIMAISDKLFDRDFPNLKSRFHSHGYGNTIIQRALYAMTSGTAHSVQYAMAAMLKAVNDGQYDFVKEIKVYGEKAKAMKQIFQSNGFYIVYDKDLEQLVGDGFYFTIGYPGMTGSELLEHLLYYGVSAITLGNTGSEREGLRACVSHVLPDQFEALAERLQQFHEVFPVEKNS